jgi:hypothetical protein
LAPPFHPSFLDEPWGKPWTMKKDVPMHPCLKGIDPCLKVLGFAIE